MRHILRPTLLGLALLGGSVVAGTALVPAADVHADALDDQVKEIADLAKKVDEGEEGPVIALIEELGENPDKRVTKLLLDLATKNKNDKIANLAIAKGAKRKDPALFKKLKSMIGDKKLAKDRPDVFEQALEAIGIYADPKALDDLEDVVKKYLPTSSQFSVPAIYSYATVQDKEVVENLLKWLEQTSATGTGSGGGSVSNETKANYKAAADAIVKALALLTGQEISDASTWKQYWEEHEKGFEFPDLDAPVEVVDYLTKVDHVDTVYGWKVTKPDAPAVYEEGKAGWQFEEPQTKDIRAQLAWKDEKGYQYVRVEFRIRDASSGSQKTPKAMVDWWVADWKDNHFGEFSEGGEPVPEDLEIDGVEWVRARAKGMGANRSKGWGAMGAEIICTKRGHVLIYAASKWRLGAEPELIEECKKLGESIEMTEEK